MSNTLKFSNTRDRYGFLCNSYPTPFMAYGKRWRTVVHFFEAMKTDNLTRREDIRMATSVSKAIEMGNDTKTIVIPEWDNDSKDQSLAKTIGVNVLSHKDMVMLEALRYKFEQHPYLLQQLKSTMNYEIQYISDDPYWGGSTNMLGKLLMHIRTHVGINSSSDNNTDIMFTNFYSILKDQGFTITSDKTPIMKAPRKSYEKLMVTNDSGTKYGFVDMYLESKYTCANLKAMVEYIEKFKTDLAKKSDSKNVVVKYFIVASNEASDVIKILNCIAEYVDITYYSPSELYLKPSEHFLNPKLYALDKDSDEYKLISPIVNKISEISRNDKLMKELGYGPGTIVRVDDFSPHYRVVV